MLYLANASTPAINQSMVAGRIGMIATPRERRDPGRLHIADVEDCPPSRQRCPDDSHHALAAVWCGDNSLFGKGYPGDDKWFAWLTRLAPQADRCVFITAPDVVRQTPSGPMGDAAATLTRSLPWLPRIRSLGYAAALVAQDGLEALGVPWDSFDALFIGGSTAWKLGREARTIAGEAKARGKHLHMGRVNSHRRYSYAEYIKCDTVDGTFLTYGPDVNLPRLDKWIDEWTFFTTFASDLAG